MDFYDADLRDVQLIMSFNPQLMEEVVKGDAIDFSRVKSISEIQTPEDLNNYVIATANQDSLVNFNYSILDNGQSVDGSVELIDNNNIFLNFVNQSIVQDQLYNIYFIWGYGKNRYHWSLVHRSLIQDINYNIHEGHKVVNIRFSPIPKGGKNKIEAHARVYLREVKNTKLLYDETPDNLAGNKSKSNTRRVTGYNGTLVTTKKRDRIEILIELIEKSTKELFRNSTYGESDLIIDTSDIRSSLEETMATYRSGSRIPNTETPEAILGSITEEDLFWKVFCSDISCFDYEKTLAPSSVFNGNSPGSLNHKIDSIIARTALNDIVTDLKRAIDRFNKKLALLEPKFKNLRTPGPVLYGHLLPSEQDKKDYADAVKGKKLAEDRLKVLHTNVKFSGDFPAVKFSKPSGKESELFFRKMIKALNVRLGLNLKYFVSDLGKKPIIFVGQDVSRASKFGVDIIKANTNKNLFNNKTGLRLIRSINPKGDTPFENKDTGELYFEYNAKNSFIEKVTIDIIFPELFNWFNKRFNFTPINSNSNNKSEQYALKDLLPIASVIKSYLNKYRTNNTKDNVELEDVISFLKIIKSSEKEQDSGNKEVVISLNKPLVKGVEEFLKANRRLICQAVARDIQEFEVNFTRLTLAIPGIPELDEFSNLFYGRGVNVIINDPSPTEKGKKELKFITGKYFMTGFRHSIQVGEGYTTYISLFKAFDESMLSQFGSGVPDDL